MENAASSITNILIKLLDGDFIEFEPKWLNEELKKRFFESNKVFKKNNELTFLVGTGNNGGDALAVARKIALKKNYKINILFFGEGKTDLRIYQEKLLKNLNFQNINFIRIDDEIIGSILSGKQNLNEEIQMALSNAFLIDGITGIGLKAPIDEKLKRRIEFIEKYKNNYSFVISIDLPTGCAELSEKILKTDVTLMLSWAKAEFFSSENRKYSLSYKVIDCDMPDSSYFEKESEDIFKVVKNDVVKKDNNKKLELIELVNIKGILKKREFFSHKGNFGRVFVISSSLSTLGAPIIACKSAIKTGAGYVYLLLKKEYESIIKSSIPYIITIPFENSDFSGFEKILSNNSKEYNDTVLIGSGFGLQIDLFFNILSKIIDKKINILIDGDGLNIIASEFTRFIKLAKKRMAKFTFTPHKKEFERLFNSYISFMNENPDENKAIFDNLIDNNLIEENLKIENLNKISMLEKGKIFYNLNILDGLLMKDYISYFIGEQGVFCNNGCFSGFAKAGTGDFIAGVFASLLSNYKIDDAAKILLAIQDQLALDFYSKGIASESIISEDLINQLEYSIKAIFG
jgi:NAD(P)H-hydrate epimerase